ncbi:MAG: response regulator [Acidobacteria bacterium]|nr:response regulator [Acidobacteriota bacterium]
MSESLAPAASVAQQFQAVFADAADAMLMLDDRRAIVDANAAACAVFGVPLASIVGESLDAIVLEAADDLAAAWRELLALGQATREHRVRAGRDDTRVLECSFRARAYGDLHLCIARDVTARRALEERLMQSEKIESIGRLAGGIAHDFNNLLTAILGYAELLLDRHSEGDPDHQDLGEIQKAGQRAASLTQQLLAFSRKQMLLPKDVDLNETVAGLRSMLARLIREDITLSCVPAPEPAIVRVDPVQIEQAILNLVLNARDALPGGGFIRLEVARVIPPRLETGIDPAAALGSGECIRLRVIDNGVGISAEACKHLFEPFYTTKALGKGTGLGLASVYGIVRQSNGFIVVDSQPGAGSTFTMYFPAVTAAEPVVEPLRAAGRISDRTATVLLVEDDEAVRLIISTVLQREGFRVLEAPTVGAACDVFDRQAAEIDLLLTDVIMPAMNGPALAQRLIAARPELRVLFISGYAHQSMSPGPEHSNVSFLSKPFHASMLVQRVRQMLAGQVVAAGRR